MLVSLKKVYDNHFAGLRQIVGHSLPLFAASLVAGITYILLLGMISREIGLSGLGTFATITSFVLTVEAFVSLQSWRVMVFFGAKFVSAKDWGHLQALRRLGLVLDSISSILGYLIAIAGSTVLNLVGGQTLLPKTMVLVAAAPLLLPGASAGLGLLRLNQKSAVIGASIAAGPLLNLLLAGTAVAFLTPTVWDFSLFWALGQMTTKILFISLSFQKKLVAMPGHSVRLPIKSMLGPKSAIPRFVLATALSSNLRALMQLDLLFLSFLSGPIAAGIYSIAKSFQRFGQRLLSPLEQALLPIIIRKNANSPKENRGDGTFILRLALGVFFIGVLCAMAVAGNKLLVLGFGEEASYAHLPTLIFLVAAVLRGFTVGLSERLTAEGNVSWLTVSALVAAIVLFGLMLVLAPVFGAVGGALSFLCATVVSIVMMRLKLRKS